MVLILDHSLSRLFFFLTISLTRNQPPDSPPHTTPINPHLSRHRPPLSVIRPLVPHPCPKVLHAPNLLPVVVRQRVTHTAVAWINAPLLDARVKVLLLGGHGGPLAAVDEAEDGFADKGASEPADACGGDGGDSDGDDGVKAGCGAEESGKALEAGGRGEEGETGGGGEGGG